MTLSQKKVIEYPVVTIDNFYNEEKLADYSHQHYSKGKMVLNKTEALLLLIELNKFIKT